MRTRSIIILVCLAALLLRLFAVAQSPTLAPQAYDTIRQVEHIKETGLPYFHDPLEPERIARPLPLFPYLIAFGTVFLPAALAYTLLPNILAVALHGALFWLALELTNNKKFATLAALASICVTSYIDATALTLSSLSLAVPLFFITLTFFIKLRKSKEYRGALLLCTLALILTHPIALLLAPTLLVALLLATVRRASGLVVQYEYAVFATILIAWFHLIYYRDLILANGLYAIHGNIPAHDFTIAYGAPGILSLGLAVGAVPFGLALYAAYKEGVARHPGIQTTIALASVAALGVALRAIPTQLGIVLFAAACIPLAAVGLQHLRAYSKTLHAQWLASAGAVAITLMFILTSVLGTVIALGSQAELASPQGLIDAANWLHENSLPNAVILSDPHYGNLLAVQAKRATYIDTTYIGRNDAEERETIARQLLAGEGYPDTVRTARIDYLVTTEPIRNDCLNTVRWGTYTIQKVLCR